MSNALYDRDLYEWTVAQAELLRSGRLNEADCENLAEEILSIGRSQKAELRRRMSRLLQHLLKWRYQPELRSRSWATTITVQRDEATSSGWASRVASSPGIASARRRVATGPGSNRLTRQRVLRTSSAQDRARWCIAALVAPYRPQ